MELKKLPELLAPAGSPDALYAAIVSEKNGKAIFSKRVTPKESVTCGVYRHATGDH